MKEETKLYFAFGSNMEPERIEKRLREYVDDIKKLTQEAKRAKLSGYRFSYNKKGKNGTGKATIAEDEQHEVWGVLFECNKKGLEELDSIECGYRRECVRVITDDGKEYPATTYIAKKGKTRDNLKPFPEYHKIILKGAKHYQLPPEYISGIEIMV